MINDPIGRAKLQPANIRENRPHDSMTLVLTLPSDASSNLTGHSLTDARKQNAEGSSGTAVGNHRAPRMLPGCAKRLVGAVTT